MKYHACNHNKLQLFQKSNDYCIVCGCGIVNTECDLSSFNEVQDGCEDCYSSSVVSESDPFFTTYLIIEQLIVTTSAIVLCMQTAFEKNIPIVCYPCYR